MKITKSQKGITLIALIITVIVLMILAAVAIGSLQDDGIVGKAEEARDKYKNAQTDEQGVLDGYLEKIEGSLIEETVSIQTDCAKYYADVDGDKEPDGVIYIDKANTKSGSWQGSFSYTITNVTTGLKEYYISKQSHTTTEFGTAPVLSLVPGSKGEERFYVIALEDVNKGTSYCWYAAAYEWNSGAGISDYATQTKPGIGEGKTNTENMLIKWNAEAYGTKNDNDNYSDIWGIIEKGWYIPSKDEWLAFASIFNVTSENYEKLGLCDYCWSSSLDDKCNAWNILFDGYYMVRGSVSLNSCVRLGTTF